MANAIPFNEIKLIRVDIVVTASSRRKTAHGDGWKPSLRKTKASLNGKQ